MSQWKSLQAAAKRAERAAKKAEKLRRDKRKSWLMLVGVTLGSIGLMLADYAWIRSQARQRHERRHQYLQHGTNTSLLPTNALNGGTNQQHEQR